VARGEHQGEFAVPVLFFLLECIVSTDYKQDELEHQPGRLGLDQQGLGALLNPCPTLLTEVQQTGQSVKRVAQVGVYSASSKYEVLTHILA
jgi:hypothetical protein